MTRSVTALACALIALVPAGCGLFTSKLEDKKDWSAEQYYKAAKEQFDGQNWEQATKLYEELESKFPYGRYAQQAEIEIAYSYFKQDDAAQAIAAADKFIKLHPNHPNVDYALYLKGLANFKEDLGPLTRIAPQDLADRDAKAARESFASFKELVTRFPDSRYVPDSRERMAYLVDALGRHEVNVAKYYLARGAYLAAANRAQGSIVQFPDSPTRRQALDIMVEAYDRMGMTRLRDDTKRILALNYPADPLTREGKNRGSPWWKFW